MHGIFHRDMILKKKYFNWEQLKLDSENDFTAILILTHAIQYKYNSSIAKTVQHLRKYLYIDNIPNRLFERRFLVLDRNLVLSRYRCIEPQNYFINPYFMVSKCPVRYKIEYMYMLSQRKITERQNFIPDYYVKEELWNNPFVNHKNGNLYFIPEIAKFLRENKLRT